MAQRPALEQLLPLPATEDEEVRDIWDYIYEPDAETLLDSVLVRYIEALVYQAVLENLASEHAARMVAMKSATDNASRTDRRPEAGLQQGPPGRDHAGNFGNRWRSGGAAAV